jgi:hypothetical protein
MKRVIFSAAVLDIDDGDACGARPRNQVAKRCEQCATVIDRIVFRKHAQLDINDQ